MKRTIIDLFEESVKKYSDFTFLLEKDQDCYKPTSYKETKLIAKQFGAGLCSLGFTKGTNLSILSEGQIGRAHV